MYVPHIIREGYEQLFCCLGNNTLPYNYVVNRMALIFRGSKFSRIALREHFVEKLSRIRGKTPRPQNGCGVIYCTCVKTPVRAELN